MTSILKVNQIQDIGGNTIVSSDGSGGFTNNLPAGKSGSFRNIIINGDMSIAQRGTSTASVTSSGYYACDRWDFAIGNMGTFTISQDTDVPTGQGFATSFKVDCTTADASPAAGDSIALAQRIEGQNLQYLKKGTANAESVTVSFWVKSNKTGTYTVELSDKDNNRTISNTYIINSASTWEKKTITFAGDTTGAFDNDNARSLDVNWWLGAGSTFTSGTLATSWQAIVAGDRVSSSQVNLADNTANNFWITGIQLEAGTTASDFEFLPYDVNLQRCLRYYQIIADGSENAGCVITNGSAYNTTSAYSGFTFRTPMRSGPSIEGVGTNYEFRSGGVDSAATAFFDIAAPTTFSMRLRMPVSGATAGNGGWMAIANNASGFVAITAEL